MKKRSDAFKKFLRMETRIENPEGPHLPAIRCTLEEKMIEVQRRKARGGCGSVRKVLKWHRPDFGID